MPFVQQPGLLLHYVVLEQPHRRAAADVVLVHGLAASLAFWYWKLAPALASAYRVLLVDLRGHGRSSMPLRGYTPAALAADLKMQLDALDMRAVHLIGHSFGGRIALQFAYTYPERVRSLVLADVFLKSLQDLRSTGALEKWPALTRAGITLDMSAAEPGVAFLEALARLRLRTPAANGTEALSVGPFGGSNGVHAAQQWLKLLAESTARSDIASADPWSRKDLAALRAPALLIYGERSRALGTARELGRCLPHSTTEIVPRAGHFFPLTRPDALLRPLTGFLREARSRASR
jgi:pimeloyl-ACP methyl ester carboxylesterase